MGLTALVIYPTKQMKTSRDKMILCTLVQRWHVYCYLFNTHEQTEQVLGQEKDTEIVTGTHNLLS